MRGKPRRIPSVRPEALEEAALRYLERFAASRARLEAVLMRRVRRAHPDAPAEREAARADVQALLDRFAQSGLLDDRVYAARKAESLQRAGASRRMIRERLRQHGVEEGLASSAVRALEGSELEAARAYARRRRLGPYRREEERAGRRDRDLAALGRRGFSLEIARAVIDQRD